MNNAVLRKSSKKLQVFAKPVSTTKIVPFKKISSSLLYAPQAPADQSKRRRLLVNMSHLFGGVSLNLLPVRGANIQKLFSRLLLATSPGSKRVRTTRSLVSKKLEIVDCLKFLMYSIFRSGKKIQSDQQLSKTSAQHIMLSSILTNTANKVLYPIISAHVLSDYIKGQIAAQQKFKSLDFRSGLKVGLSRLVNSFFKRFFNGGAVRGLRIVCAGRWSKTRSSRKQRLVINRGSLKRLTLSAFLDYGSSTVTTKFGVCSIKV